MKKILDGIAIIISGAFALLVCMFVVLSTVYIVKFIASSEELIKLTMIIVMYGLSVWALNRTALIYKKWKRNSD